MKDARAGYEVGDRPQLRIERIVPGGAGLARGPAGVVLVDLAAPGDVAEIEIESIRGGVARGTIFALLEPSPARIEPPCPWFGTCGGCDLQHLAYSAQLDAKVDIVRDALARVGGIAWDGQIERFAAPKPFGSRIRVELHRDSQSEAVGFFERRSKQIVAFDRCMVASPAISDAIDIVRISKTPALRSVHLLAVDDQVRSAPAVPPLEGGSFWIELAGTHYLVDPAGFFQSSLDLLPGLIDRVTSSASPQDLAWDLFCGVGLFALPLARVCGQVSGVELDGRAVRNAQRGAVRNELGNAAFEAADVVSWMKRNRQRSVHPDLIVVDPPRSGLGSELSELLTAKAPQRLTYVSCDPVTLARDLRILTAASLQIEDIAVFDLFPQTHHVETVVRLSIEARYA